VRPRNPAQRTDLPRFRAPAGTTVRLHLGFAPRTLTVQRLGGRPVKPTISKRVASWRLGSPGVYVVSANGPGQNSVSYAIRIA
jgi:hypothetical protein